MLIGNPYQFSIFTNVIKEWNIDESFCNGILLFCVNGELFPKEIVTATLKREVPILKEMLMNISVNEELYNKQKEKAFAEIYSITFPDDINNDNDYRFDISPASFTDNGYYIFAVSNGVQVRIMAAKLNYIIKDSRHELENLNISETFISSVELDKIISNLGIY